MLRVPRFDDFVQGFPSMSARLKALDGGPDILINQDMVVVGRHPSCDARLDSLRLSRHHCCLTEEHGAIIVRDLGSTNGISINGERVKVGRLRLGDELAIAHFRYRVDEGTDGRSPVQPRPRIEDLFSPNSRFRFISRN
jgi:pSer/pThr/pTyr-binding forkhead associated (FHA) protein